MNTRANVYTIFPARGYVCNRNCIEIMAAGTDCDVTVVPLSEEASFYEEDLDAPSVSVSSNCSMIINMHTVPCSTSVASNCTLKFSHSFFVGHNVSTQL